MSLWSKIETISNNINLLNEKTARLNRKDPIELLTNIRDRVLSEGVSHRDASYVKEVADGSGSEIYITVSDYHESSMAKSLSFHGDVDKLITFCKSIKDSGK